MKNNLIALVFLVFGLMTIVAGGKNLFSEATIATRGNVVPLVLWFNFIAGFFYLITGILVFKEKALAKKLAFTLATLSAFMLLYLAFYVFQGGAYENKTPVAMAFRTFFWVFFALYLHKSSKLKLS